MLPVYAEGEPVHGRLTKADLRDYGVRVRTARGTFGVATDEGAIEAEFIADVCILSVSTQFALERSEVRRGKPHIAIEDILDRPAFATYGTEFADDDASRVRALWTPRASAADQRAEFWHLLEDLLEDWITPHRHKSRWVKCDRCHGCGVIGGRRRKTDGRRRLGSSKETD